MTHLDKSFAVSSITRRDLMQLGFDEVMVSRVSDSQMEYIATKMGDNATEQGYWDNLEHYGEIVINQVSNK